MEYLDQYSENRNKAEALIEIANQLEKLNKFLDDLPKDEDGCIYISINNKK